MHKLIRVTTVALSLDKLLEGQLDFMRKFYDVTAIASDKEYLERIGRRERVATHAVRMTRRITPFQDMAALVRLYLYFKKHRPLIVHSHTPKAGVVAMLAARLANVPHRLHTVAGLPLLEAAGFKRRILDAVEKLTYRCATKVYPNSFGLSEIIRYNKYCDASKLKVIAHGSSNGIDTDHFSPGHFSANGNLGLRRSLGIGASDFTFIFIGRLVGDKGINELVRAFADLYAKIPRVRLLLIGPTEGDLDPLQPETARLIASHEAIIATGYKDDVRPYLAIADALVFPSYREGFPNVVMQAGAMGLPAIVSDINGCNEIIFEGRNGLIVPPKDQASISLAMQRLAGEGELCESLRGNARELIVTRYDRQTVWDAILAEYRTFEEAERYHV